MDETEMEATGRVIDVMGGLKKALKKSAGSGARAKKTAAVKSAPHNDHLDAIAGGARWCYFVPTDAHDGKGFIPSLVVEGVAGHVPMSGQGDFASPWYWGDTYEQATRTCEKVNRERGILPETAAVIVASSMGATSPAGATRWTGEGSR